MAQYPTTLPLIQYNTNGFTCITLIFLKVGPIGVCFEIDQSEDEMKEALKAADSQLDDAKADLEVEDYKKHSEEILKVFENTEKLVKVS